MCIIVLIMASESPYAKLINLPGNAMGGRGICAAVAW